VFDLPRLELGEQVMAVWTIAILAGAELHAGQTALRIDCGVDLGVQASTGSPLAASFVGLCFFSPARRRPPTPARWT
jgi:hypothetical protein